MPPKVEGGVNPRKVREPFSKGYGPEPIEESLRKASEYEQKRAKESMCTELQRPDKDEFFINSMKTSFSEIQRALDRLAERIVREERPSSNDCRVEQNIDSLTCLMANGPDWIEGRTSNILQSIAGINELIF